jgi:ubiquinone/menaquinone biosynthesis C-methylase UbiE
MNAERDSRWFESFFDGLWLDVQSTVWAPEKSSADASACLELLQLLPGQRVLDVPCGEGRIALEFAARGYAVTGLDFTEALLERARAAATERGLRLELRHGDMRDLPFQARSFDGAVCLWGSLGYGTEFEDRAFLTAVARVLEPAGRFVLDTHVLETLLPHFEERGWYWAQDVLVAEDRRFDPTTSRVEADWTLSRRGRMEQKHSSIRIYSFRELADLLHAAGFSDLEAFGSLDLEPFEVGASRLVVLAVVAADPDPRDDED